MDDVIYTTKMSALILMMFCLRIQDSILVSCVEILNSSFVKCIG